MRQFNLLESPNPNPRNEDYKFDRTQGRTCVRSGVFCWDGLWIETTFCPAIANGAKPRVDNATNWTVCRIASNSNDFPLPGRSKTDTSRHWVPSRRWTNPQQTIHNSETNFCRVFASASRITRRSPMLCYGMHKIRNETAWRKPTIRPFQSETPSFGNPNGSQESPRWYNWMQPRRPHCWWALWRRFNNIMNDNSKFQKHVPLSFSQRWEVGCLGTSNKDDCIRASISRSVDKVQELSGIGLEIHIVHFGRIDPRCHALERS